MGWQADQPSTGRRPARSANTVAIAVRDAAQPLAVVRGGRCLGRFAARGPIHGRMQDRLGAASIAFGEAGVPGWRHETVQSNSS